MKKLTGENLVIIQDDDGIRAIYQFDGPRDEAINDFIDVVVKEIPHFDDIYDLADLLEVDTPEDFEGDVNDYEWTEEEIRDRIAKKIKEEDYSLELSGWVATLGTSKGLMNFKIEP